MSGVKCRKYVLRSYFSGSPKRECLELVEETLPALKDGEILCQAEWLSVDPYMRGFSGQLPLGSTMLGEQVAKVIESKNPDFAVGDYVIGGLGWASHSVCAASVESRVWLTPTAYKVDSSVPKDQLSLALGVLGMPGATAYFGFLDVCKPKSGETLVVTGAAGAVGSLVGQIGKIKGCRVVGFAGSDAKVEYLKSLGFDVAINYKTMSSLDEVLKENCPDGVDMFYDNVGGKFFNTILNHMKEFGRVGICGAISQYNLENPELFPSVSGTILGKQLKVEGFVCYRWMTQWPEAFKDLVVWVKEGKIKFEEHVTEGFDNMFDAFTGLFRGDNMGKTVVKA